MSVSVWIGQLKRGCTVAAERLWQRYVARLTQRSERRLGELSVRAVTADDVVVDVFDSLYRGAQRGRFPRLNDRDDLWQVLLMLVKNKVVDARRKRLPRTESSLTQKGWPISSPSALKSLTSKQPSPARLAEALEQVDCLLSYLTIGQKEIAQLKLEGLTNGEISQRLNIAVRTVERRLKLIRDIWKRVRLGPRTRMSGKSEPTDRQNSPESYSI